MATQTLATASMETLVALATSPASLAADVAAIANIILDDLNVDHPISPGAFVRGGFLHVPNRGVLKVLPGDVVAVDDAGWPILVSADSIANGSTWDLT